MSYLKKKSAKQLLNLHSNILEELKRRQVIRTQNTPVADYGEWLVKERLDVKLEKSSNKGFDALDKKGTRYQIKTRHLTKPTSSRQLGVIRNLSKKPFDFLIALFFDKDYGVEQAYSMPIKLIKKYARYSKHQNGHILIMKGKILTDKVLKNITYKFH